MRAVAVWFFFAGVLAGVVCAAIFFCAYQCRPGGPWRLG